MDIYDLYRFRDDFSLHDLFPVASSVSISNSIRTLSTDLMRWEDNLQILPLYKGSAFRMKHEKMLPPTRMIVGMRKFDGERLQCQTASHSR